jgi:hypothetical protein
MAQSRLLNPAGDLVGTLEGQPTPEAVLRAAYGLSKGDVMMSLLDGDSWHLGILVMDDRAEGEATRFLPFSIKVGAPGSQQADRHLMELALLDLWDKGWSLEVQTDHTD